MLVEAGRDEFEICVATIGNEIKSGAEQGELQLRQEIFQQRSVG